MYTGFVVSFSDERGYGFVRSTDGDRIFAHRTDVQCAGHRILVKDEPVVFDVVTDHSGRPRAVNIRRTQAGAQ